MLVSPKSLRIQSYLLRRYLEPPNLHNSVSNHLLRGTWIARRCIYSLINSMAAGQSPDILDTTYLEGSTAWCLQSKWHECPSWVVNFSEPHQKVILGVVPSTLKPRVVMIACSTWNGIRRRLAGQSSCTNISIYPWICLRMRETHLFRQRILAIHYT